MTVHENVGIEARLGRVELAVAGLTSLVDAMDAEIGGVPRMEVRGANRRTLRDRVHAIENDRATARAAEAAVEALAQMQRETARHRWTVGEKIALLFLASLGTLSAVTGAALGVARLFGAG